MKNLITYIGEKLIINKDAKYTNEFKSFTDKIIKTSGIDLILTNKYYLEEIVDICNNWVNEGEFKSNFDLKIYMLSVKGNLIDPSLMIKYGDEYIADQDKYNKIYNILTKYGKTIYKKSNNKWSINIRTTKNIFRIVLVIYSNDGSIKKSSGLCYVPVINSK